MIFLQANNGQGEALAYLNNKQAKVSGTYTPQTGSVDFELPIAGYEKMGAVYQVLTMLLFQALKQSFIVYLC